MPNVRREGRTPTGQWCDEFDGKPSDGIGLTTMAGRVLRISVPIVGSRFTNQISPRVGETLLVDKVSSLPILSLLHLGLQLVEVSHVFRLIRHPSTSFLKRQSHERSSLVKRETLRCGLCI